MTKTVTKTTPKQANQQLSSEWTLMRIGEQGVPTLEEWVGQQAAATRDSNTGTTSDTVAASIPQTESTEVSAGQDPTPEEPSKSVFRLAVDPWLLSAGTARSLSAKLAEAGGSLVPIAW